MTIQDLDLGFLYEEKKGMFLGKNHPFDEKWKEKIVDFSNYLENTSIINYFKVMIHAHRDEYPRDYWIGGTILKREYNPDFKTYEDEYMVIDGKYFIYPELKKIKRIIKLDPNDFEYVYEYVYEFNKQLPLIPVIEDEINGKLYTKTEEEGITVYSVENSPINTIKIGNNYLSFTINEAYYVRRMS